MKHRLASRTEPSFLAPPLPAIVRFVTDLHRAGELIALDVADPALSLVPRRSEAVHRSVVRVTRPETPTGARAIADSSAFPPDQELPVTRATIDIVQTRSA